MTLKEFGQLYIDAQTQHILENDQYLMNRQGQWTTASLYVVSSFYAEVWYDREQNGITAITSFNNVSKLDAYLKGISLDKLSWKARALRRRLLCCKRLRSTCWNEKMESYLQLQTINYMQNLTCLFLLLFLLLMSPTPASAQLYKNNKYLDYSNLFGRYYYREPVTLQFGAGLAASRGDYCGSWNCNRFGIYLNAGMYTMIQPGFSAGVELAYFGLGAQYKNSSSIRILNFRGKNLSLVGILKINLLKDKSSYPGKVSQKPPLVMPYLKVGIGGLAYSVRTYLGTERFEPKGPEGSPVKYPRFAVVFPLGAGLAFRYNYRTTIQPELLYHFTTTNALDGAVGLSDKRKYDGYGIASIKVQYAF